MLKVSITVTFLVKAVAFVAVSASPKFVLVVLEVVWGFIWWANNLCCFDATPTNVRDVKWLRAFITYDISWW